MTGTFDDWAKSVKLDKTGTGHKKKVDLPEVDEKIFYKVSSSSDFLALLSNAWGCFLLSGHSCSSVLEQHIGTSHPCVQSRTQVRRQTAQ